MVVKNLSLRALAFHAAIIKVSFCHSYFPTSWKIAKAIAICKPGKPPDLVGSNIPISLLLIPGKVCKSIVANRLKGLMCERQLLPDREFGFRERHSTTHGTQKHHCIIGRKMYLKNAMETLLPHLSKKSSLPVLYFEYKAYANT